MDWNIEKRCITWLLFVLNGLHIFDVYFQMHVMSKRCPRIFISLVEEEVAEIRQGAAASEDATESTSIEGGPQKKKLKKGLFFLLEDLMDSPSVISDIPQEAAKKKVHQYLSLDASPSDNPSDPIKWWKPTVFSYLFFLTSTQVFVYSSHFCAL